MDSRQSESVCENISPGLFGKLEKEVRNNGIAAIHNRRNMARRLEGKDAKNAELEAAVMLEIAGRKGIKL